MKDEEMAEEWVDKEISLGTSMYNPQIEHYCKQAFLAGLKAGRPQWHKVADGDLPKEKGLFLFRDRYEKQHRYINYGITSNIAMVKDFDEWCEIPTFDKE